MDFLKNQKFIGFVTGLGVVILVGFFYIQIFSQDTKSDKNSLNIAQGFPSITVSKINTEGLPEVFKESYSFEKQGKIDKAIGVLMDVYDKNNYMINLRLGWLYYSNKKYAESMEYYQNAINAQPNSIEARLGFVMPAAGAEDWVKVTEKYNEILSIDPNNSTANYRLGLIYYYKPDYTQAFKYFEKVANMYPFDYSSVLMLGWTNYQLGKSTDAKALFERTLCIVPDDASALEGLGLIK